MKVVLDTNVHGTVPPRQMKRQFHRNVLISGLAYPNSIPGRIVAAWDLHALGLAMSRFQLDEVSRVLRYPKIRKLLGWDDARIESFVRQLLLRVELVDVAGTKATVPADPCDAPILATLIASSADVLVTGDGDLLAVRQRYPIETPAEFARRL